MRTMQKSPIKKTSTLWLFGLMVFPLLVGCGQSKQAAIVSIDEAKLSIASARKAKADVYAAPALTNAEASLGQAEKRFNANHFVMARQEAEKATQFARDAESEAQRKTSERKSKKRVKKA